MREHEVPTHVQAEDKVLLGFTFPQIVALTAVCALSYGAYSYAPVGPRRGADGHSRRPGACGGRGRRGEDRGSAAAVGGRRPAAVLAGGAALRRATGPACPRPA